MKLNQGKTVKDTNENIAMIMKEKNISRHEAVAEALAHRSQKLGLKPRKIGKKTMALIRRRERQ